jgi:Transposase DDE domain group 1
MTATPAIVDPTPLPFSFPALGGKKLTAAFDAGRLTSDGGVLLLGAFEKRLGICTRLAGAFSDARDPARIRHSLADILRARVLAIACGYEDANDLDRLRTDPGFKIACGRLPDSGGDLCSQPTISRWENAPDLRQVVALTMSPSTSTTPSMRSTATSNCRSSTPSTTRIASCRSMSTTPRPPGPSR